MISCNLFPELQSVQPLHERLNGVYLSKQILNVLEHMSLIESLSQLSFQINCYLIRQIIAGDPAK
jgi:hypothetical protein